MNKSWLLLLLVYLVEGPVINTVLGQKMKPMNSKNYLILLHMTQCPNWQTSSYQQSLALPVQSGSSVSKL